MKKFKIIYMVVPVFVVIMIVALVGINQNSNNKNDILDINTNISSEINKEENIKDGKWIIKEKYGNKDSITETTAIVPRWSEMTITQKFGNFEYLNTQYCANNNAKFSKNIIGNYIDNIVIEGYDTYEDIVYNINANLYEVIDFKTNCVIAVQFDGDEDFYVYLNLYYRPDTLEKFIDDLNLENTVKFGTICYNYWEENLEGNMQYKNIEFYDVEQAKIWNILFDDLSLENIYSDTEIYKYYSERYMSKISINIDMPVFGYENIGIELTDKGYLITNIFGTGKGFYIGEDKVQEFLDYIIDNYDGYEIVYINEDEELENEEVKPEEKILVTEKNLVDNSYTTREVEITSSNQNFTKPYNPNK